MSWNRHQARSCVRSRSALGKVWHVQVAVLIGWFALLPIMAQSQTPGSGKSSKPLTGRAKTTLYQRARQAAVEWHLGRTGAIRECPGCDGNGKIVVGTGGRKRVVDCPKCKKAGVVVTKSGWTNLTKPYKGSTEFVREHFGAPLTLSEARKLVENGYVKEVVQRAGLYSKTDSKLRRGRVWKQGNLCFVTITSTTTNPPSTTWLRREGEKTWKLLSKAEFSKLRLRAAPGTSEESDSSPPRETGATGGETPEDRKDAVAAKKRFLNFAYYRRGVLGKCPCSPKRSGADEPVAPCGSCQGSRLLLKEKQAGRVRDAFLKGSNYRSVLFGEPISTAEARRQWKEANPKERVALAKRLGSSEELVKVESVTIEERKGHRVAIIKSSGELGETTWVKLDHKWFLFGPNDKLPPAKDG